MMNFREKALLLSFETSIRMSKGLMIVVVVFFCVSAFRYLRWLGPALAIVSGTTITDSDFPHKVIGASYPLERPIFRALE
jgi:hypothetical protein